MILQCVPVLITGHLQQHHRREAHVALLHAHLLTQWRDRAALLFLLGWKDRVQCNPDPAVWTYENELSKETSIRLPHQFLEPKGDSPDYGQLNQ